MASDDPTKSFWDERYASAPAIWSGHPNPHLVTQAGMLTPGTVLDVGCGEGADAIWLAEQGWTVTALDISTVALARAAGAAENAGVADQITWQETDLTSWTPPGDVFDLFDLVSSEYMHLPTAQHRTLMAMLANLVRPGGTLLVVAHHPSDLHTGVRRPKEPDLFRTAEDMAAELDPQTWRVEVADASPREVSDPDGNVVTIHDARLRAVRTV